jgi:iron complex outermembrane receptor protein
LIHTRTPQLWQFIQQLNGNTPFRLYYDSKGNERLYFKEFDSPSTNNGITEGLDYERYKNFFAEVTFHDFTFQGNYHSRKKGVPTASYEALFNNERYFTVDEQYWLDLKYEHMYSSKLNILARVNYNNFYYHGDYPYEGDTSIGEREVVINKDYARGEWIDSELQFIDRLSDKHRFILGTYYRYNCIEAGKLLHRCRLGPV